MAAFALFAAPAPAAPAPAPTTPPAPVYDAEGFAPGLAAHYYRDEDLWTGKWPDGVSAPNVPAADHTFGQYKYTRVEPLISHLFINRGWFSVRWQGYLTVPATADPAAELVYKFYLFADDGCRLFIDGDRVIDDWRPCSETAPDAVRSASRKLKPGRHKIVVEYFQGQSLAVKDRDPISLSWECRARGLKQTVIPEGQFSFKQEDLAPLPGRMDGGAAKGR
jgi:hypothetical protein